MGRKINVFNQDHPVSIAGCKHSIHYHLMPIFSLCCKTLNVSTQNCTLWPQHSNTKQIINIFNGLHCWFSGLSSLVGMTIKAVYIPQKGLVKGWVASSIRSLHCFYQVFRILPYLLPMQRALYYEHHSLFVVAWYYRKSLLPFGNTYTDSKVHGSNMGSIWGRQDPGGPHVGPMNFAIWDMVR